MSIRAATSIHARSTPTASRAVSGDSEPYVVVHLEAGVHTRLVLSITEEVEARTDGGVTMFLSEGDALKLASQLVQAARKVQPVATKWEMVS